MEEKLDEINEKLDKIMMILNIRKLKQEGPKEYEEYLSENRP